MTTRNIFILSIVFAEILFLSFSKTYELPSIDTNEMKNAVATTVLQNQKLDALTQAKLRQLELVEEQRLLNEEQRLNTLKCEGFNKECYDDGNIVIVVSETSSLQICLSNPSFELKKPMMRFFDFSKESEMTFFNKKMLEPK